MKKLMMLLVSLVLILSLTPAVSATYDRVYIAPFGTPHVDGLAESLWDKAEWTDIDKPYDGTNDSDSVVRIKLLWDDEFLYFLAEVYDTSLNVENDIVEIYLDQLHNKSSSYLEDDSQTRFRVSGTIVTGAQAGTNAQVDCPFSVEKVDDNNYVMEGQFYWTDITPGSRPNHGS